MIPGIGDHPGLGAGVHRGVGVRLGHGVGAHRGVGEVQVGDPGPHGDGEVLTARGVLVVIVLSIPVQAGPAITDIQEVAVRQLLRPVITDHHPVLNGVLQATIEVPMGQRG